MKIKKLFCLLLALCIPALLPGCGEDPVTVPATVPQAVSYAVTVGDHGLTGTEFNYYYLDAIAEFYDLWPGDMTLDPSLPLNDQYYDAQTETTWADHFVQQALQDAKEDLVLCDLAKAAGFSLTDDHKEELAGYRSNLITDSQIYGFADVNDYLQSYYSPNSNIENYMAHKERAFLADAFYTYHWNSLTYSEDVIRAQDNGSYDEFGTDKMGNVRHLLVTFEGGTEDEYGNVTYSDEDRAATEKKAQEYLDMWRNGAANEEYFIELVKEYSQDTYLANGGLYENITADSNYVDNFKYWATDPARMAGETGIIETEYGYHVMYFTDWSQLTYRDYMITEDLREADQEKWLKEAMDAVEAEVLDMSGLELDLILAPDEQEVE